MWYRSSSPDIKNSFKIKTYLGLSNGETVLTQQTACGSAIDRANLPTYGDAIEEVVKWNSGSDVSALAGKPIRLRFVMTDADLYSIRFRD